MLPILFMHLFAPAASDGQAERLPGVPKIAVEVPVTLPPSLEHERGRYLREIGGAVGYVDSWFDSIGLAVPDPRIVTNVVVFDDVQRGRKILTKAFGQNPGTFMNNFGGTVQGHTLFLASERIYHGIWNRLYPDWPWTGDEYWRLMVHEITHATHEAVALHLYGNADAMGPSWFFEGLAVYSAGQFPFNPTQAPMSPSEIEAMVGNGRVPPSTHYPLYYRIFSSLALRYPVKQLVEQAGKPGFPDNLWIAH